MVPRRTLGRTGISVPLLGLGTVKLGRREEVKYPEPFELPDEAQARRLLDTARALGIDLLDTAPAYGESETRLGRLLRHQRNDWLIVTKVGETFARGRSSYDFSPEAVRTSVKGSLARLRTDRLDVVLIHSDGNDLEILDHHGTLECLRDLKTRGWIRAVGISHKTTAGGQRAIALGADVIMATLNETETDQAPVIAAAGAAGVGVLVKKALASGHAPASGLRFAASQPGVSSVIVGTLSPAHLEENARLVADL
ncbi:MAG: aldo/keto reductase [Pseudomonadales bacterium]|jgi:aryl-alcohol dehydrogenase-like predicted oxidoreductase